MTMSKSRSKGRRGAKAVGQWENDEERKRKSQARNRKQEPNLRKRRRRWKRMTMRKSWMKRKRQMIGRRKECKQ